MLDGRLTKRRKLGLYPDEISSTELILDAADDARGAIVVGLGDAGRLTQGDLRRTLTRGLLRFSAYWLEHSKTSQIARSRKISVSALLIGSAKAGFPSASASAL